MTDMSSGGLSPRLCHDLDVLGVRSPAAPAPAKPKIDRTPTDPWWKRGEECPH